MKWYFEDFTYGSIDGAVTTFAVVAGAIGASLSPTIILNLGFANLFADGFSMLQQIFSQQKLEINSLKRKQKEWKIDITAE